METNATTITIAITITTEIVLDENVIYWSLYLFFAVITDAVVSECFGASSGTGSTVTVTYSTQD